MHKNLFLILLLSIVIDGGLYAQAGHVCDVLFLNAAKNEDMAEVMVHLKHSWGNINAQRRRSGKTALMYAIETGNLTLVNLLMNPTFDSRYNPDNISIDLDLADKDGKTALVYAIEKNNIALIKTILSKDKSFSINNQDNKGMTALHYAVEIGSDQIVADLFNEGADPNLVSESINGVTPFMVALQKRHTSMIPLFIGARTRFDITRPASINSLPPLLWALQNTMPPGIIREIIQNFPNAMESRDGSSGNSPIEFLESNRSYGVGDYQKIQEMLKQQLKSHIQETETRR